ncbi:MAG: chemotaxis protein CheW [Leptolyngbyaceae cyanobacterium MO_188.B28]|nr:chemotaxis protein CheW [Leptolyngbyaceae cyanobacterium MO_188.B28]
MKSTLSRSKPSRSKGPLKSPALSQKLIVFEIGKLVVAFPIERVYKIINRTPVHSSGLSYTGITQIDGREITVVDLHQRLFGAPSQDDGQTQGYLVIVQSIQNEFFSIPTANTPTLMAVPLSRMRTLPEAYRRSDTLEIASHVAMISHAEQEMTIFLLDVNRLI